MPTTLEEQELKDDQENDSELKHLIDGDNTSLKLQKLSRDATTSIYCDISTGYVRPYIPASLRRRVFAIVHNPSHPSVKAACQQLRQKYVWPNIRKDILSSYRTCISCQRAKVQRHNRYTPKKIDVPTTFIYISSCYASFDDYEHGGRLRGALDQLNRLDNAIHDRE
jgi:hypothetical protein